MPPTRSRGGRRSGSAALNNRSSVTTRTVWPSATCAEASSITKFSKPPIPGWNCRTTCTMYITCALPNDGTRTSVDSRFGSQLREFFLRRSGAQFACSLRNSSSSFGVPNACTLRAQSPAKRRRPLHKGSARTSRTIAFAIRPCGPRRRSPRRSRDLAFLSSHTGAVIGRLGQVRRCGSINYGADA